MSQRQRHAFGRLREGDLEKDLRSRYREYEEWRTAQAGGEAGEVVDAKKREEPKRFRFGRLDLLFIVLGVLAGLIYQSCKTAQ